MPYPSSLLDAIALAALIVSLGAIAFLLIAIRCVLRFEGARLASDLPLPAVTLLKPLCGEEPHLHAALRSFCAQDYPAPLQIVFGARSASDPAVAVVEALRTEFPDRDIALVIDAAVHGPNLKVSNLVNMARAARHDVFVISDSDVIVEPDCLRRVAAALNDPAVGASTCLFRGAPARADSLVAQLGSLYIDGWFLPSAVVDATLFGSQVCYGPVTAIRRAIIDGAGGFQALTSFLADDTELGHITERQGRRVALAGFPVDTMVSETRLGALLSHEVRWARTTRALRPGSYVASVFTHALPVALLLFALWPTHAAGLVLGCVAALRAVLLWAVQRRFGRAATALNPTPWFLMIREVLYFGVWAAAFAGRSILWRGRRLRVLPGARVAVEETLDAAPPALGLTEGRRS
jgi:ceramide glucosyltransferase